MSSKLDRGSIAHLQNGSRETTWTYVIMPDSVEFFGTRGLVKVRGTIDGHPFRNASCPWATARICSQ